MRPVSDAWQERREEVRDNAGTGPFGALCLRCDCRAWENTLQVIRLRVHGHIRDASTRAIDDEGYGLIYEGDFYDL